MGAGFDETHDAEPEQHVSEPTPPLAAGDVFANRYEIETLLGKGGMGAVYRVKDRKLDETVALKLLMLSTPRAVDRFVTEVRLARRVTHANVARTHDFGEDGDVRFLTMEYVAGKALSDVVVQRAPLSGQEVLDIGAQIAEGLAAAHAAGVIHRDLKPENVIVADDGRVVLTDFGISRAVGAESATRTGMIIGTPHYMAPEQVAGKSADERSDLYALGLILYELSTGTLPFDGDSAVAIAMARLHTEPVDPRRLANLDDGLADLIVACIAREPADRPPTAVQVLRALRGNEIESLPPQSGDASSQLFAPLSPGRRTVAVLPFSYRGASDHDYLGEGLAEELVDVLSRTRGLSVLSLGATRRFADDRDPARIHSELSVEAIVEGTVQLAGERIRITARLVEKDGVQRWSDRLEGSLTDVFALQEAVGRRIAEALRIEIVAASYRRTAPIDAIERYLKARRLLRTDMMSVGEEAVVLLDEALTLAPDFGPAIAAHAMASVRAWWGVQRDDGGLRARRARQSVARASEAVPDLPETQLSRGLAAYRDADYAATARSLARALELAPTLAEAHHALGELQLEAGRASEGLKRLELALELDPSLNVCHLTLAKHGAMTDDEALYARHTEALARMPQSSIPILGTLLRMALYRGDRDDAQRVLEIVAAEGSEAAQHLGLLGSVALGEKPPQVARRVLNAAPTWFHNIRFTTLLQQIVVEVLMAAEADEPALDTLTEAANGVLLDTVWMQRCPLLTRLRDDDRFIAAHQLVRRRADAVWL